MKRNKGRHTQTLPKSSPSRDRLRMQLYSSSPSAWQRAGLLGRGWCFPLPAYQLNQPYTSHLALGNARRKRKKVYSDFRRIQKPKRSGAIVNRNAQDGRPRCGRLLDYIAHVVAVLRQWMWFCLFFGLGVVRAGSPWISSSTLLPSTTIDPYQHWQSFLIYSLFILRLVFLTTRPNDIQPQTILPDPHKFLIHKFRGIRAISWTIKVIIRRVYYHLPISILTISFPGVIVPARGVARFQRRWAKPRRFVRVGNTEEDILVESWQVSALYHYFFRVFMVWMQGEGCCGRIWVGERSAQEEGRG